MQISHCLLIASSLLVFSGCADNSATRIQLDRLTANINDVRNLQATQTTQIATLEGQLRQMLGRLEELEHAQNNNLTGELSALKSDLSNLQRRVPPPPIVPAQALDEDEAAVVSLPPDIAPLMNEAYANIRLGKFQEAILRLREANNISYGKDALATIQFWLGVALDGVGENRDALAAYHEVVTRYPKHPRVPLALLRQGSVLVRLGDPKTAGLTFKKLIADFPKSTEAQRAKERLKDLG